MPIEITPALVKDFWKDALVQFGARSVDKNDSAFMKGIGSFLDFLNVLDSEEFLENFTTTIFTTIYRPFEIGNDADGWGLWSQISICVHELVHVQQYLDNPFGFPFKYLAKSPRAEYEAQAYSSELELHHWRHGELFDIRNRLQTLRNYSLEAEHIDYAVAYLESIGETVLAGGTVNPVAAWALDWLEERGVQGAQA